MTKRNKLLCGALSVLAAARLGSGICYAAVDGIGPCESLSRLVIRISSHQLLVQSLPEMNLDAYRVRLPHRWRPGELAFTSTSVIFGMPLPFGFNIIISPWEILAYLMSRASTVLFKSILDIRRERYLPTSSNQLHTSVAKSRYLNQKRAVGKNNLFVVFLWRSSKNSFKRTGNQGR